MRRPRLLLTAATTGYQMRQFAAAADRLGVELVLATDRCHILDDPWGDRALPVRFERLEESADLLAAQLRERPVDGILGVADRPALLGALAAEKLGLPFHPSRALARAADKHAMRDRLKQAGLPVPHYWQAPLDGDIEAFARQAQYPCVLKPTGLSASRGVIRADSPREFSAAFSRIKRLLEQPDLVRLGENQPIQVEQYLPGREFAIEGVMTSGSPRTFAIFDKPDPLEGPYFEETIYVTPSREPESVQRQILQCVQRAAEALEFWHGPIHAEVRVNDEGVWLLEAAGRPIGGLCAQALRFTDGETLESVLVRHACGQDISSLQLADAASGVMMIPIPRKGVLQRVSGVEIATRTNGVTDLVITAKPGQELIPLPEGASYLGFIFAAGDSPETVEAALREAHSQLRFEITAALPVI